MENADQRTYWNEVAGPKWAANQVRLDRFLEPFSVVLNEAAAARDGECVLDVGCGCGDVALRLAGEIGAAGRVLGIDLSEPMLAQARARTAKAGLAGRLDWVAADAMTHPFQPAFDVLVSRFGLMFFDDPTRAFANLRQALKPGGRFAFVAWRGRAEVEWMQAPLQWLAPVLPMPDNMDGAIGPCAFADAEATCAMLVKAGFAAAEHRAIDRSLFIGSNVDDAWSMLSQTGPAAAAMREMPSDVQPEAETLMRAELSKRIDGDRIELGGACWLYSGRA